MNYTLDLLVHTEQIEEVIISLLPYFSLSLENLMSSS